MRKLTNGATEYKWFNSDTEYNAAIDSSSETYEGWTAVNFDETKPFTVITRSQVLGDCIVGTCFHQELAQLNPDGEVDTGVVDFSTADLLVDLGTTALFGKSWLAGRTSFQTTIEELINGLPSLPVAGGSFPKTPSTPNNIGNREFGKVMKWGTGDEAARARMATLTKEELQRAGVTKELAAQWRDFYREVARVTPANTSAAGRADLMQRAVEILSK